jgi:uncharacterized protein (DUF983 family)
MHEDGTSTQLVKSNKCSQCGGVVEVSQGADKTDILGIIVVTIFLLAFVTTGVFGRYTISIFIIIAVLGVYTLRKVLMQKKFDVNQCKKCQSETE